MFCLADHCDSLGFKVVGGRVNEDGKRVTIVTEVQPNSIAERRARLMIGESMLLAVFVR